MIQLTDNKFSESGYWSNPVPDFVNFTATDVSLFDQNGYDLTMLEECYAPFNRDSVAHRYHRTLKQDWFTETAADNAALNHSILFERKAYAGAARHQLEVFALMHRQIYKILAMRPKWGLDFSMDWADVHGNAFEVLHWEYDGFNHDEIQEVKLFMEPVFQAVDWQHAGAQLLKRKDEWHALGFFEQSAWKCRYFNIMPERFKMVIWE